MRYRVAYDISETELSDAGEVEAFFATRAERIAAHGRRANAYWLAPAGDDEDVLRVDVDFDAGRAAVRWLADETHAVEVDPVGPIVVLESPDVDVVTIPAVLARVSVPTACRAAAEYVATGRRPTCVTWTATA